MSDASPERYRALALQVACRAVNEAADRTEARALMMESLARLERQIEASRRFIGPDCRLVVLPEYFLTGFPSGEEIGEWTEKAALEIDGPEYRRLGEITSRLGIYLSGNAYETDPHFPGLYFQTSFLVDDRGEVILRYRRLNSLFAPTPHDVWDRYLEVYGLVKVFPVARTPLGNLAAIASEEILFPEVARCLAMRGAEVFLHSSSEAYSPNLTPKDVARRARAIENLAYVVSANSGGMTGTAIPASSTDGGSQIVDYLGQVLAETGPGESMSAFAAIDLAAQRACRRRPGMPNLLARQRFDLYAQSYGAARFYPANTMAAGIPGREHFLRALRETIERLIEDEKI